jgi:hypothetical protein
MGRVRRRPPVGGVGRGGSIGAVGRTTAVARRRHGRVGRRERQAELARSGLGAPSPPARPRPAAPTCGSRRPCQSRQPAPPASDRSRQPPAGCRWSGHRNCSAVSSRPMDRCRPQSAPHWRTSAGGGLASPRLCRSPARSVPAGRCREPCRFVPRFGRPYCSATGCALLAGPIVHCGLSCRRWQRRRQIRAGRRLGVRSIRRRPRRRAAGASTVDCRGSSPLRCASHSSSVSSCPLGSESSADHRLIASASSSDGSSSRRGPSDCRRRLRAPRPEGLHADASAGDRPSESDAVDPMPAARPRRSATRTRSTPNRVGSPHPARAPRDSRPAALPWIRTGRRPRRRVGRARLSGACRLARCALGG